MKYLLIIFALTSCMTAQSQTVLLMHDVEKDKDSDFGPGKTNYGGAIFGYGLVTGKSEDPSLNIEFGKSYQISYGYFYRYQAAKFLSFGYTSMFNFRNYRISQEEPKFFVDSLLYDKERFYTIDINLAPFMRFNLSKRGNHHGFYIDLSAYGSYNFVTRHIYHATEPFPSQNESVKVINRNLRYINRFEYGGIARFGFRNLILFGQYRMSNHFKPFEGQTFPELPRFIFGISFSA